MSDMSGLKERFTKFKKEDYRLFVCFFVFFVLPQAAMNKTVFTAACADIHYLTCNLTLVQAWKVNVALRHFKMTYFKKRQSKNSIVIVSLSFRSMFSIAGICLSAFYDCLVALMTQHITWNVPQCGFNLGCGICGPVCLIQ